MALCEFGDGRLNLTELKRLQPDTVVVQNAISDNEIELLQFYREFKADVQIVFMLDDLLHDLPEKSSQYRRMKAAYRDARTRLRKALGYCDRLVVSTQPLADMCRDMIDDIVIVPNRLQKDKWLDLQSQRRLSAKPRVGWAGAQQHQGDLELIIDVVKETADEIDWIFFGMCPDEIKPYIKEEHDFVDIENYPQKLASLNLDLAVAPLEDHDFNVAKSNLRLLEYGILGWPVICSDIFPYQTNNAPVIRVSNDKAAWLAAIRQALADPLALQQSGNRLKQWVIQHYLLEDHLDEWLQSLSATGLDSDFIQSEPVSGGVAGR
jgi:glycosyltransferase involved in cell wall biosynthesis